MDAPRLKCGNGRWSSRGDVLLKRLQHGLEAVWRVLDARKVRQIDGRCSVVTAFDVYTNLKRRPLLADAGRNQLKLRQFPCESGQSLTPIG